MRSSNIIVFWMMFKLFMSKLLNTLTIICSRLSSLVLYMMGRARPQDTSKMVRKTITAPRLVIWSRLVCIQTRWPVLPPAGTGTWRWTCICPQRWPCWWGRTCRQPHTGRSSQTWAELEVTRLCTRVTDIRYWHRIYALSLHYIPNVTFEERSLGPVQEAVSH